MHGSRTKRVGRLSMGLAAMALGALALASGASARPFSSTGSFVIGDQSANVGSTVTFWGAQWWKDNDLSGGTAPASFKGFADTAAPGCGETWTTRPGDSSFPPETVSPVDPETGWVRMVVSSHITKDGPVISGDTAKVVLVAVDPGYGPNPGHAGTGTVMREVCPGGGLPS